MEMNLEPINFDIETTTVWSFPQRGKWATHNSDYRGNWSPFIPRNIIMRYSKQGDYVLDQFLGSGTTLIETKLLGRRGIGVDINPAAIEIAKKAIIFKKENCFEPEIINGNANNLNFIENDSVDLICTHPPYANIIRYSNNIEGDLSLFNVDNFIEQMKQVAMECFRVIKSGKFCTILMGDTRSKRHIVPLGFSIMNVFIKEGFLLREIIIKEQHNCRTDKYWDQRSVEQNFLLIAHEYLFVFRKP